MDNAMTCPTDEVLMDAALARASGARLSQEQTQLVTHAQNCNACTELLALWSGALRLPFAHTEPDAYGVCLDENTIAEYFDGVMAWEDRVETEAHLATCLTCAHQLAELHTLVGALQPARTLPQVALGWLRDGFRLMGEGAEGLKSISLSTVPVLDAPENTRTLAWELESESGPIRVSVQHDRAARATLRLTFPADTPLLPGRCQVRLKSEGKLLESRSVASGIAVEFSELDSARYEVEVEVAGDVVGFCFSLTDLEPNA